MKLNKFGADLAVVNSHINPSISLLNGTYGTLTSIVAFLFNSFNISISMFSSNIGVEKLFAIASGLGVSPWYLLGQTEDPLAGVIECLYRYCAKSPLGGLFSDYRQVLALLRWEGLDL